MTIAPISVRYRSNSGKNARQVFVYFRHRHSMRSVLKRNQRQATHKSHWKRYMNAVPRWSADTFRSWHTNPLLFLFADSNGQRKVQATKEFIDLEAARNQVFSFFQSSSLRSERKTNSKLMKHLHKAIWPTAESISNIFSVKED